MRNYPIHGCVFGTIPDHLLEELQKYVSGETVYILRSQEKKRWGAVSGARTYYQERNERIRDKFHNGDSIDSLADEFKLSTDSIRKIVYKRCDDHSGV